MYNKGILQRFYSLIRYYPPVGYGIIGFGVLGFRGLGILNDTTYMYTENTTKKKKKVIPTAIRMNIIIREVLGSPGSAEASLIPLALKRMATCRVGRRLKRSVRRIFQGLC